MSRAARRVRELAELAGDEVGGLLADVDRVVADPLEAPRDDDHAQAPLPKRGVVPEREHVLDNAPVAAVDELVQVVEVGPRQRPLALYSYAGFLTGAVGFSAGAAVMRLREAVLERQSVDEVLAGLA